MSLPAPAHHVLDGGLLGASQLMGRAQLLEHLKAEHPDYLLLDPYANLNPWLTHAVLHTQPSAHHSPANHQEHAAPSAALAPSPDSFISQLIPAPQAPLPGHPHVSECTALASIPSWAGHDADPSWLPIDPGVPLRERTPCALPLHHPGPHATAEELTGFGQGWFGNC